MSVKQKTVSEFGNWSSHVGDNERECVWSNSRGYRFKRDFANKEAQILGRLLAVAYLHTN